MGEVVLGEKLVGWVEGREGCGWLVKGLGRG